ncbi:UPF0481 protein At3g47200-like [Coffea arabica]|uniref:UPF0481 protein At3g47200-like n=1 Tax=Coffea arabica TaxID=13443 RepID=A0A6P6SA50_COFAR
MEYQAINIDESEQEKKLDEDKKGKRAISLPNGNSSNEIKAADHKDDNTLEGRSTHEPESRSWRYHEYADSEGLTSRQQQDQAHFETEDQASVEYSLNLIEGGLEKWRQVAREEGNTSSICIFRLPCGLTGTNEKAEEPELVSIGPYHRGKNHLLKFEEHKWYFLDKILSRNHNNHFSGLSTYLRCMRDLEARARACYSDKLLMSSHDFVEMMLLDACFVVGLLRHLGSSEDSVDEDDPIFTKPWIIPILIRDLLKLENQLPFFVLEELFLPSWLPEDKTRSLPCLALTVFDLFFPLPSDIFFECMAAFKPLHLLDLFYLSLLPSNQETKPKHLDAYRPSSQSIQSVTELRPSGIKLKPRKADSFLDIKFHNRVLEIPAITVNDFTRTLLLNCVAWEQCQEDKPTYFTDYISFMNCLIHRPRDVALLCLDGIITRFSQDDMYVADFFNNLGKNVVINVHSCYLYKEFKELDAYFNSYWATMMRTYFRSPWSFISAFSAFLIIVLSFTQTIMSVLTYQRQFG